MVRIEAETFASSRSNFIGGVDYAWAPVADTPGYSGTGYIEAAAANGTSTNTVATSWETTSPHADYTVTFSNAGTYYFWVRGYAGDAASAGLYIGLNGASPAAPRIDMAQYNASTWANTAAGSANHYPRRSPRPRRSSDPAHARAEPELAH